MQKKQKKTMSLVTGGLSLATGGLSLATGCYTHFRAEIRFIHVLNDPGFKNAQNISLATNRFPLATVM